jgi:membrane-associated phospholipid phosphatase
MFEALSAQNVGMPAIAILATSGSISLFLVTAFLLFCCTPPFHAPARNLLQPLFVALVENGIPTCRSAQQWQRPWLTKLLEFCSHSVSVGFYGSFLPALIWCGLPELGWHLVVLMTLTLYVGNAIKDLIASPRPLNIKYGRQKIKALGSQGTEHLLNAQEYGFPSSHTMNSLALNYYAVHYLYEHNLLTTQQAVFGYLAVAAWVAWIALSRLYLGLHTPVDILGGALGGLTTVTFFTAIDPYLEGMMQSLTQAQVGVGVGLVSLILLRLHPKPPRYTPSFEFSTFFMGVLFGGMLGVNRMYDEFYVSPIVLKDVWGVVEGGGWGGVDNWRWKKAGMRLAIGFLLLIVCKEVSKAVFNVLLPILYGACPITVRKLWQPPVGNLYKGKTPPSLSSSSRRRSYRGITTNKGGDDNADNHIKEMPLLACDDSGKPWDVKVTAGFFSYAAIGLAAFELAPRVFIAFNL